MSLQVPVFRKTKYLSHDKNGQCKNEKQFLYSKVALSYLTMVVDVTDSFDFLFFQKSVKHIKFWLKRLQESFLVHTLFEFYKIDWLVFVEIFMSVCSYYFRTH